MTRRATKGAAPTLRWHLTKGFGRHPGFILDAKSMEKEIRSLLAVEKEARGALVLHSHPGNAGDRPKSCAGCRLMRALARASRGET